MENHKQRIIQELVPGKQITLAHIIANPDPDIYTNLSLENSVNGAVGIMTITPPEAAIIIADIAMKAASVRIVRVDWTSGSLIICGKVDEVQAAVDAVLRYVKEKLGFEACDITKT